MYTPNCESSCTEHKIFALCLNESKYHLKKSCSWVFDYCTWMQPNTADRYPPSPVSKERKIHKKRKHKLTHSSLTHSITQTTSRVPEQVLPTEYVIQSIQVAIRRDMRVPPRIHDQVWLITGSDRSSQSAAPVCGKNEGTLLKFPFRKSSASPRVPIQSLGGGVLDHKSAQRQAAEKTLTTGLVKTSSEVFN